MAVPWVANSDPVTSPVDEPIVMLVVLLLHTPPATPSVNCVVSPPHIVVLPVIAVGNGFTVTVVVMIQVVGNV